MRIKHFFLVLVVLLASPVTVYADLTVDCSSGCEERGGNLSVNLILRATENKSVTLLWRSSVDPTESGQRTILFYAGNPSVQDTIPRRPLVFSKNGNEWQASATFTEATWARVRSLPW